MTRKLIPSNTACSRFVLLLLAMIFTNICAHAQDKEFWFVAPDASYLHGPGCDRPTCFVITTGSEAATVEISMPANTGFAKITQTIAPNSYKRVEFAGAAAAFVESSTTDGTQGTVTRKGFYIKSTAPISAYYQVDGVCSKDIFTLKGAKALGTEFYTPFQTKYGSSFNDGYAQIQIVATENGTSVTIDAKENFMVNGTTPTKNTTVTLNKGETFVARAQLYALAGNYHLIGTKVTSTKPIAITVADDALANESCIDIIGDQIVPVNNIGTNYVIIRGQTSAGTNDQIYVIATQSNTNVYKNNTLVSTLANPGDFYQYTMPTTEAAMYISTSKPVYTFQQSGVGCEMGGALLPSMYSINSRRVAFHKQTIAGNYLFLVVRSGNQDGFLLNGSTSSLIPVSSFSPVPSLSDWMYAVVNISSIADGQCVVENKKGAFSLGYFLNGGGTALYGYLSGYGQVEFADTTFVCLGQSTIIDAGYAKSYKWWKGQSGSEPATGISTSNTYTVPVGQFGYYTVKVDQDPFLVTATTYVEIDTFKVRTSTPSFIKVNSLQNLQANVKRNIGKAYAWTFDAGTTPATSAAQNPTGVSWSTVGIHNVTLKVTNSDLHCDTTLTQLVTVYDIQDDYASTMAGMAVTTDVLANDNFPGCTPVVSIATAPLYGTATVVGNKVKYTPNANFVGGDVLTYKASCGANEATAQLRIQIAEKPDNISDADCYGPVIPSAWSFKELMKSPTTTSVNFYSIPLVGDIDNDGKIEVVVPASATSSGVIGNRMYVFKISGGQVLLQQTLTTPKFNLVNNSYSIANVDGDNYSAIFLITSFTGNTGSDVQQLVKYGYNGTSYVERWRVPYVSAPVKGKEGPQPMIVDFNGDGIAEVLVYDKVFNARTGQLLVDAGYLSDPTKGFGYGGHINTFVGWDASMVQSLAPMAAVADIDGDGVPEVIGGNCVYKVTISNTSGTSGNSFQLLRTASTIGHPEAIDGATSVADMDGDGMLDVVVTTAPAGASLNVAALYIWNPRTGQVMNTNVINNLPRTAASNQYSGPSLPFIGDVDNDKQPEICFTGRSMMYAYEYNPTTKLLTQKWSRTTSDASGATTMVMFDFNQDGKNELVYRDETHLRILNGEDGTDKITPVACTSSTGNEYPVVADINGDGAAEIVVTGGTSLLVYASSPVGQWAPARKVWNQFAYNAVNINENLTVPKVQMNPATVFTGGSCGTVRPFNAYLQQQTTISAEGCPVWLLPNATVDGNPVYSWNSATNTLEVKVSVKNIGSADLIAPVYASLYKNTIAVANLMGTGSSASNIAPGATGEVVISIPNISSKLPISSLHVRLNDNGTTYPVQTQCKYDGNINETPFADMLIAQNDTTNVRYSVPVTVPILDNDSYPCGASVAVTVLTAPTKGSFVLNADKTITYTLTTSGFSSTDFLDYQISCGANLSSARVFFMVSKLVAVDTIIGTAKEGDPTKGKLRFYLLDNVTHTKKLRITFSLSGTAVVATDYSMPSTSILPIYSADIPIGQNGTEVEVTAINNFRVEGPRKAMVKIEKVEEIP